MKARFEYYKNILIISPIGELDHCSIEKYRCETDMQIKMRRPKNIIFDLRQVTFIDSSGIGYIIGRYKHCIFSGGKTAFVNVSKTAEKILEISGLLKIIKIYPSADSAISAMEKEGALL